MKGGSRIDSHAVKFITSSNLNDARTYIRDADAKTLEAALIVMEVFGTETKTRRKLIDVRLRQLSKSESSAKSAVKKNRSGARSRSRAGGRNS